MGPIVDDGPFPARQGSLQCSLRIGVAELDEGERMHGDVRWLLWARRIHALAKTGEHYAKDRFERERAQQLLAIAAEIVAEHSSLSEEDVQMRFSAQEGYITPKVDVRAAVLQEGRLLMAQESMDGGWTLPGGWADVGETPSRAVEREVLEETGVRVRADRLIGVFDANRIEGQLSLFHAYKLLFLCTFLGGKPGASPETLQADFFPLQALPEPFSAHRTTPRHIDAIRRAVEKGDVHVPFD